MVNPYDPLLSSDQLLNPSLNGYNELYPSGEAHFFDIQQAGIAELGSITIPTSGIFDRNGLISPFSSGPQSRNYAITNFRTFNPYRHYVLPSVTGPGNDTTATFDTSSLLQKSTYNFNIYSTAFRKAATTNPQ